MKSVTIPVDDETYRNAIRRAAGHDRTIESVISEILQVYGEQDGHEADWIGRLRTIWADLDARGEGIAASDRMTRAELYDSAIASRGRPRA